MLAIILFVPFLLGLIFYCFKLVEKNLKKCFAAKFICSSMFVIIGLVFYVLSDKTLPKTLVLAGLVLGALGDIILEFGNFHKETYKKYFLSGGGSFLLGHFMYIAALLITASEQKSNKTGGLLSFAGIPFEALLLSICVVLIAVLVFISHRSSLPYIESGRSFKLAVGLYLAVVAVAASLATAFTLCLSVRSFITYSIGLILFLTSDSGLMKNMFGAKRTLACDHLVIVSYYLAQFAMALALYI